MFKLRGTDISPTINPKRAHFGSLLQRSIKTIKNSVKSESKISKLLKCLKKIEIFDEKIDEEFNNLVDYIINIEKWSEVGLKGITKISFQEMIVSLINLADPSQTATSEDNALIVLKIFKKIIESEIPELKKSAIFWEYEDYVDKEFEIKEKQNQLVKLGIVNMLFELISSQDSNIVNLLLNFN